MVDIVVDGYDVGICYGGMVFQDMVVVLLIGELCWVVVVLFDYLVCYGVFQWLDDLLWYVCICMCLGDNLFYKWELGDGEWMVEVDVFGFFSVNESNMVVVVVLDGVGLVYCLEVGIVEELCSGWL